MIDLQTLLTYLTLISVPVGVIYHIMTLNNTRKTQQLQLETRQASLFQQIYSKFGEPDFIRNESAMMSFQFNDYDDFLKKYGSQANPEAFTQWMSVVRFYHGVAVLVEKGLIDIQLVYDLMGDHVIEAWEKERIVNLEYRKRSGDYDHGRSMEILYNKLKELKTERIQS